MEYYITDRFEPSLMIWISRTLETTKILRTLQISTVDHVYGIPYKLYSILAKES